MMQQNLLVFYPEVKMKIYNIFFYFEGYQPSLKCYH